MAYILGNQMPLHTGFVGYIQLHGHVQLVGWAGLFVMGVSLHFLPRLASVPLSNPRLPKIILRFMLPALVSRAVFHSILPYLAESAFFIPCAWLVAFSGLLEFIGVLLYILTLVKTLRRASEKAKNALRPVKPFLGMVLVGWVAFEIISLALAIEMAWNGAETYARNWNNFANAIFIGLVLLPVAFTFSIKTFPLYLRLASIDWPVRSAAIIYLAGLLLQILPFSPVIKSIPPQIAFPIIYVATIVKALVIIIFVWKLDLFYKSRPAWSAAIKITPKTDRKPTRKNMPDYGEFGRFERLIYSAYFWLVVGAVFEAFYALSDLLQLGIPHGGDLVRHAYLLGFITLLIFGMSVRMIPGFLKKKRIASTKLVDATFWLGNTAAVFRIAPLAFPATAFDKIPLLTEISGGAFAYSGVIGMAAILCLMINLQKTMKQ